MSDPIYPLTISEALDLALSRFKQARETNPGLTCSETIYPGRVGGDNEHSIQYYWTSKSGAYALTWTAGGTVGGSAKPGEVCRERSNQGRFRLKVRG